ncbi:MAG: spore germination protein [Clostridium sp.]|uniref:spore germination protein n=1 Tax=Clostridium sp. TaxID=1506 RepID=UPI002911306B|nr:spore germination protein [Clostridium sp.]MDU7338503.1 spore germination protein [Clostridium sp.]
MKQNPSSLKPKIEFIQQELGNSKDLSIQKMNLPGGVGNARICLVFLCSLADKEKTREMSIEIDRLSRSIKGIGNRMDSYFEMLQNTPLSGSTVTVGEKPEDMLQEILEGHTVILFDGLSSFLSYNTYGPKGRSIEEPTSQTVIRGPKEGFTEQIESNLSQIRRRIRNKALRVESFKLGSVTKTNVALLYIETIAKESTIREARKRLNQIEIDSILESEYIEEMIRDNPGSLFPTIYNTERPDAVSASLLEGKIAILVDGTPYVLTAPTTFFEFFISSEDHYHHPAEAALFRFVRILSMILTVLVPGSYIALTTFDQELIPTPLLLNIAAQREGVPLPTFIEAILMEITFEVLREAGIRMPRAIGPAISIVGALVLGQAAVQAGFVSAAMVIVVSITAIASFCIPNTSMADTLRIIRFIFMMFAGFMGLYGIFICLIGLVLHLCSLKSFGVPYMAPLAPIFPGKNTDSIIRSPLWKKRPYPSIFSKLSSSRSASNQPMQQGQTQTPERK